MLKGIEVGGKLKRAACPSSNGIPNEKQESRKNGSEHEQQKTMKTHN